MGFWYSSLELGFYAPTPKNSQVSMIFYFEALCVFCALKDIASRAKKGAQVVIYMDNLNTMQIFNSLSCLPAYNHLLHHSVDILLSNEIDLCALHIPGEQNTTADALSHCQFMVALNMVPRLLISPFQPP